MILIIISILFFYYSCIQAERNIFAYVRPEEFKKIRAGIIDLILSTDMSRHTEIMERFRGISAKGFDYNKDDHRRMVRVG